MFTTIQEYLGQFAGKEVWFLPNPGNGGDSVIATATYQLLEKAGIRYRVPNLRSFDPGGRFILYGGGGNLVDKGTHSYRVLRRVHRTAKHLTILPHTIKGVDDLLGEFGSNVTVIARERVTHDYVSNLPRRYETLLMDDMAFSLDVAALLNGGPSFDRAAMLSDFVLSRTLRRSGHTTFSSVKRYLNPGPVAASLAARPPGGVLNCFRLDGEATDIERPPDNIDLSQVFAFGVAPLPVALHGARSMLGTLAKFDEIRTNRLHVAVSAALLGKPTQFFPNNYYKCRAVWEYSMQDRFPNVTWMG
jgi:hypothetical protein